jgi:2-polyprenyl-3-methyl-5-hydroxy-6-metoxy-1,4-benzoquinol methylase
MSEGTVDQAALEQFMGQMIGTMTGGMMCFSILLGDELGLYKVLAGAGQMTAEELAGKTGCNARLTQEWLDGQVAGGIMTCGGDPVRYELRPEAVWPLADESSPVFLARGMNVLASVYSDVGKIADAFRGDGGMSWGEHHPCLFKGTEWFFRTGYRAHLPTEWIPALDGVDAKLRAGARVADVGCGHGASAVVMADAYPASRIFGFDFHGPSVETARQRAEEAGVADRTTFEQADARGYQGTFDLICFFDCLHDMGDPVGVARHAREHLDPDGSVLLVEPFALDGRATNQSDNPMAALFYAASTAVCLPNSLSQDVGLGLGAQAGEARLREVFAEAGFTRFQRAAETPVNLILQARP